MDMSEISRDGTPAASAGADTGAGDRWHALVSEIGAEVAAPLTGALERIHTLIATGKIDRAGLRALRDEVEHARQTAMIGQQLARFASGRLRQSHERIELAGTLEGVLTHRQRETAARGITLKPSLKPADVIVDPSLLFSLINTVLDWALAVTQTPIEFTVDLKTWPVHGRLVCRFGHQAPDLVGVDSAAPPARLDSLAWRLIEQLAATMELPLERRDDAGVTTLTIEFPRTVKEEVRLIKPIEIDDGFAPSGNAKPLAGSQVLVISARRDLRAQIRDALRNMGLVLDFVSSVEEAQNFCREALPHAIIVESIQRGSRFAQLRDEIVAEVPDFVFIEIIEEGSTFETTGFGGSGIAKVGRDVIASSLPSALMFEMSKGG
jgi:hypothetical protein